MTDAIAYLFTHVQSGEIVADVNPYFWEGEREMWHRQPMYAVLQKPLSEKRAIEIGRRVFGLAHDQKILNLIRTVEKSHGIM